MFDISFVVQRDRSTRLSTRSTFKVEVYSVQYLLIRFTTTYSEYYRLQIDYNVLYRARSSLLAVAVNFATT